MAINSYDQTNRYAQPNKIIKPREQGGPQNDFIVDDKGNAVSNDVFSGVQGTLSGIGRDLNNLDQQAATYRNASTRDIGGAVNQRLQDANSAQVGLLGDETQMMSALNNRQRNALSAGNVAQARMSGMDVAQRNIDAAAKYNQRMAQNSQAKFQLDKLNLDIRAERIKRVQAIQDAKRASKRNWLSGLGAVVGAVAGGVGGFFVGGPPGAVAGAAGGANIGGKLGGSGG